MGNFSFFFLIIISAVCYAGAGHSHSFLFCESVYLLILTNCMSFAQIKNVT